MLASIDKGLDTNVSLSTLNNHESMTDLAVSGQVDLESLCIVFKPERRHGKENVFAVDGFALFLLTFLRSCG